MLQILLRIETVNKYCVLLAIAFLVGACASDEEAKGPDGPISIYELPSRMKSRVEMKNADGTTSTVNSPGSKETSILDPKTGKRYKSQGWVDSTRAGGVSGKHLRSLTQVQLAKKSKEVSAREATLIVEELRSRREKGIRGLASMLADSRKAVFPKGREYWWYEKKDVPAEEIEIGIYAAYALQFTLKKFPSGVYMDMTKDRMFYAVKDKYAVVKQDLKKVWLEWWSEAANDY